ncbi:MAG: rod-binding protein [Mariprofundaceae bacterium]|nr:rod-binding protein [Mariprofundaceae bacterium]
MRDLVETVISQVMRQESHYSPATDSPARQTVRKNNHRTYELTPPSPVFGKIPPANDKLWQASRQFETLFVEQMLTSMRKTVPDSGFIKKGFADDVQTSMLDQAIAEAVGKQGRMGIAQSLYRQLSQHTQAIPVRADNVLNEAPQHAHDLRGEGEQHGAY